MKHLLALLLIVTSYQVFAGSELIDENGVDLMSAPKVYTLVNLHPDEQNSRLYAVNYQLPAMLPLCTEVKLEKFGRKKLIFTIPSRGNREYTYLYHKAAAEPFDKHLLLFFGTECNTNKVKKLSKKDQEGVKRGEALAGMTRQGVLYAMGRPPKHVNPTLDTMEWMYWRNKFARKAVMFNEKGIVTGTR